MDWYKFEKSRQGVVRACDDMVDSLRPTRFHPFVLIFPLALVGVLAIVFSVIYSAGTVVYAVASALLKIAESLVVGALAMFYVMTIAIKYTWKAALKMGGRG